MNYSLPASLKLLPLLLVFFSCTNTTETTAQATETAIGPIVSPAELLSDFKVWWTYHYERVDMTTDFVALDENGELIEKEVFLSQLTTGEFFTVEQQPAEGRDIYRLYPLAAPDHPSVSATIKSVAKLDLKRFRMEGIDFPGFSAPNLLGEMLDNEQLSGKYTVLKTWFIACKPCIVEFPELNELVEEYQEREDVQFISLAIDEAKKLQDFLVEKPFSYQVVADQQAFIQQDLHLSVYPTHLVVGPDGKVLKVVGNVEQLKNFLKTI